MKHRLARFACLLLLLAAPLAVAQQPVQPDGKPDAKPHLQATLLLIKNDWSAVPAAKEIEADLRAAVKDAPVPKELVDKLPLMGPAILFSQRMVSFYRAESFADLLAWLKARGLLEKELPFTIAEPPPPPPGAIRGYVSAQLSQPTDFLDLGEFPQFATQPFLERKAELGWTIYWHFHGRSLQVERLLTLTEKRRGQSAFEAKERLDQLQFSMAEVPAGAVTVANPAGSGDYLTLIMDRKGSFFPVLAIQTSPAPEGGKPANPKIVLPEAVNFFEVEHDPRLSGTGRRGRGGTGGGGEMPLGSRGGSALRGGRGVAPTQPSGTTPGPAATNPATGGNPISTTVNDRERVDIFQLQHIRAESLLAMLQEQFGRSARLTADTDRQRIIASTSNQADADKIAALINQLDSAPQPGATGGNPAAAKAEFVIVPLRHVRTESLFPIIQQLAPRGAGVIEDSDQQRFIVTGSAADLKTVSEAIARLDTPPAAPAGPPPGAANPLGEPNSAAAAVANSFIRQLQLQNQLQQPTASAVGDLQRQYQQTEQQAQAEAQKWRALTARSGGGDVQTSTEIASAKVKLQSLVTQAFLLRQRLQREELLEMQRRIYGLANTIEDREKIKDQIIDRRVQELLNPALQWNPPAAANPPNAFNPLNVPRNPATGSPLGQFAPAKGAPVSGGIVQVQGNIVHVSIGLEDDIRPGQVLHVFRGDEYVAELEVQTVAATRGVAPGSSRGIHNDLAVTRVKRKLSELRQSDQVFTEAPARQTADPTRLQGGLGSSRPLSDAVREFNVATADNPLAKGQPPLTDDEVVAAIRWTTLSQSSRFENKDVIQRLISVADTRIVPSDIQLEVKTDFERPSGQKLVKWSIRMTLPSAPLPNEARNVHVLREQFINYQFAVGAVEPSNSPNDDGMPLVAAISGFNQRHANDPIGKDQPPLTKDEVVAALCGWLGKRDELAVTNAEFAELEKVVQTGQIPAKAELEVLTSFQPNGELLFDAWSVRLRMPRGEGGGSYAYTIRDRWLRVKKLNERQVAWGPVSKSGLQVGVWIDPPNGIFSKGQQFVPHFYFKNAGDKEQSISLPRIMTHGYYEALHITDDSGRNLQFDRDEGPGGPVGWTQLPFPPGAEHEVTGLPVAVGMVKRAPGVETVLCAEPGQQCRLKFSLDDYLSKEDPKGPLETGELRFAAAKE